MFWIAFHNEITKLQTMDRAESAPQHIEGQRNALVSMIFVLFEKLFNEANEMYFVRRIFNFRRRS